ncbi:RHS repeat-associated core domain-containing protein [Bryobacter aggregatus]|uniref:RHS repeat-associated core domain-containing protein n=1 Tax=Bryobacter aggregatus TaxID=360054 RepID=UPI0009B5B8BB
MVAGCLDLHTHGELCCVKFTGKERDAETGLDYFGARYLVAGPGRFTIPDWSEMPSPVPYADFSRPQTLNLYSYINNNPITLTDPDGHCAFLCTGGIGAVAGGAIGGGVELYKQAWLACGYRRGGMEVRWS